MPLGFVNVHFSLLPRWRGAAPVERAMLAGDAETGVCIMELEKGLDTGAVYARAAHADRRRGDRGRAAGPARRARHRPPRRHAPATSRRPRPRRRSGEPTYADKLTVEEFELDFEQSAEELARVVRAGNPRPGAWTTVDGGRLKVWRVRPLSACIDAEPGTVFGHTRVATGDGALELVEVQPEGAGAMSRERLAGRTAQPDPVLGT